MSKRFRGEHYAVNSFQILEYLDCLQEAAKAGPVDFNFHEVIENYHEFLGDSIFRTEAEGLKDQRENVYQNWLRYQMAGLSSKVLMAVHFSSEINRVLVDLSSKLSASGVAYRVSRDCFEGYSRATEKDKNFRLFSSYVDAYVEIQLCNIHVAAVEDVGTIKNDIAFGRMNNAVLSELVECVKTEMDFWQDEFSWKSPIYHCVMEEEEVDVSVLLRFMGVGLTVNDIWQSVWRRREITNDSDLRVLKCSWRCAPDYQIERLKGLVLLLRKVEALDVVLLKIKEDIFVAGSPVITSGGSGKIFPNDSKPWG